MKNFANIIKGILLSVIAIAVFSLNIDVTNNVNSKLEIRNSKLNQADQQTFAFSQNTIKDYFFGNAFAQGTGTSPAPDTTPPASGTPSGVDPKDVKTSEEMIQKVAKNSQLIFQLFQPAIFFFTKYISLFLGTDFVFGGKMGEMLHGIWVICRNIVNIVFVLILLFLAIKHIFGKDENTDIKKVLPSFALMLIAVNFSWLASRLIVDAANVATNVVFAIPNGIGGVVDLTGIDSGTCTRSPDGSTITNYNCSLASLYYPFNAVNAINMKEEECKGNGFTAKNEKGVVIKNADKSDLKYGNVEDGYKDAYKTTTDADGKTTTTDNPKSPFYRTATYCWKDMKIGSFNSSNAAYQLTYSMARVTNLPNATAKSVPKLVIGTIFALFIEIVYLGSFAALTIILIFRAAFLWLFVSISPVIVLMMFLTKTEGLKGLGGGAEEFLSIGPFIQWAFAPAKVAAVWTIGFIMITTGQVATNDLFTKFDAQGSVSGKVFQVSSAFMGMNSLQEMIWLIMTIVIIWMGTMGALKNLKGAQGVVGWIEKQGNAVGNLVSTLPTVAPIIPTIDLDKGKLDFNKRMRIGDIAPAKMADRLTTYLGGESTSNTREFDKAERELKKRGEPGRKELRDLTNSNKTPRDLYNYMKEHTGISEEAIKNTTEENIKKMYRSVGLDDKDAGALATKLKKHVDGTAGPLNPAVTVPPDNKPALNPNDITNAMKDALRTQEIKLANGSVIEIKNLSQSMQDNVAKKAQEIAAASKDKLDANTATKQAVEALRTEIGKDAEAEAAKKAK